MKRSSNLYGDLRGALVGAAVVLPQATAFGMTVFAPYLGTAPGALAGLMGAIGLLMIAGLIGGTSGLISGPTGATMALLAGTAAVLGAADLAPADIASALFAITALAGVAQWLIAVAGGARLMKFIPYPVIAGLTTGTGLLLMKSQYPFLLGLEHRAPLAQWHWLPVATAVGTFLIARYLPRQFRRLPGPIAGLAGGTLLFHVLVYVAGPELAPPHWTIGALPAFSEFRPAFQTLSKSSTLPWPFVLQAAFTLAVLASLNTLLTSAVADTVTGLRHDPRRTLLGQSLGQIAIGLAGGMASAASVGGTATASQAGARRWAAPLSGLILLVLLLFLGPVGRWLPTSMLSGIIIASALNLLELDILAWARRSRTRLDAGVALLVIGVTLGYDLMVAVLVGLAIAILLFVQAQSRISIIHTRQTGLQRHSVRQRPVEQRAVLDLHGDRIVMYQLRGILFFAKTEQLFEDMLPDLNRPAWVILHLRQVLQIDLSSVRLFQQIAARLEKHGGELLFCEVREELGLGRDVELTLRKVSLRPGRLNVKTFGPADQALEYAENALLNALDISPAPERRFELAEMDLCRDMKPVELNALAAALRPRELASGERLFSAGDPGAELYLVLQGQVDILLPSAKDHYKRLGIYGPGTVFGAVAFLDPGPRTADAVAVRVSELLVLNRADFNQLQLTCPDAAIALLLAMGRQQSSALRWSAKEIQRLIQW
ncbi:MAG: SLC26A/SulP transporter family protein [Candidatus Competibacteraceae bacterium]|nr:SLC26A/SulP transporter family protein [Candidatus Competibacteraceae bacterium]